MADVDRTLYGEDHSTQDSSKTRDIVSDISQSNDRPPAYSPDYVPPHYASGKREDIQKAQLRNYLNQSGYGHLDMSGDTVVIPPPENGRADTRPFAPQDEDLVALAKLKHAELGAPNLGFGAVAVPSAPVFVETDVKPSKIASTLSPEFEEAEPVAILSVASTKEFRPELEQSDAIGVIARPELEQPNKPRYQTTAKQKSVQSRPENEQAPATRTAEIVRELQGKITPYTNPKERAQAKQPNVTASAPGITRAGVARPIPENKVSQKPLPAAPSARRQRATTSTPTVKAQPLPKISEVVLPPLSSQSASSLEGLLGRAATEPRPLPSKQPFALQRQKTQATVSASVSEVAPTRTYVKKANLDIELGLVQSLFLSLMNLSMVKEQEVPRVSLASQGKGMLGAALFCAIVVEFSQLEMQMNPRSGAIRFVECQQTLVMQTSLCLTPISNALPDLRTTMAKSVHGFFEQYQSPVFTQRCADAVQKEQPTMVQPVSMR